MMLLTVIQHTQFLPNTLGGYSAIVGVFIGIIATTIGLVNRHQIADVHVLVNSNLADIKQELSNMTNERDIVKDERDHLQYEKDAL